MVLQGFSIVISLSVILTFGISDIQGEEYTPVVIWHGLGDSAKGPYSNIKIIEVIKRNMPGVHINSLQFGVDDFDDVLRSVYDNANIQVQQACAKIAADPKLKSGFNAIGISQGGQLLRALVQRCSEAKVGNLITLGSQHQGQFGAPLCPTTGFFPTFESVICENVRMHLSENAVYTSYSQKNVMPAQYWRDPLRLDWYRKHSGFLVDINNEVFKNETYVKNLQAIQKLVMVKFTRDRVVKPVESEWFGFYKDGQDVQVQPMNKTDLYKQDWLGLQKMDQNGQLVFLSVDRDHLQFDDQWFIDNIIDKYLDPK